MEPPLHQRNSQEARMLNLPAHKRIRLIIGLDYGTRFAQIFFPSLMVGILDLSEISLIFVGFPIAIRVVLGLYTTRGPTPVTQKSQQPEAGQETGRGTTLLAKFPRR